MFDHYEWFKNEVYRLTQIDLNYYKEKQMRRRIDSPTDSLDDSGMADGLLLALVLALFALLGLFVLHVA